MNMRFLTILLATSSACSLAFAFGRATNSIDTNIHVRSIAVLGAPNLETCPTSNCPANPPVLSSQFIHGVTSKDAKQHEWLSNIGLLVRTGSPNGQKVAQYIGVMQQRGAGTAWALNTDLVRNANPGGSNSFKGYEGSGEPAAPGLIGTKNGSIGYELDFTNWDSNSATGQGAFTVGEYVHAQGSFTSLSALYLDSNMDKSNKNKGWHNGIMFNGNDLIASNTILDATTSDNSITILGRHLNGLNTTNSNPDLHAVIMRAGQTVCFNGPVECLVWQQGSLTFINQKGLSIFSVDEEGNAYFRGHVRSR